VNKDSSAYSRLQSAVSRLARSCSCIRRKQPLLHLSLFYDFGIALYCKYCSIVHGELVPSLDVPIVTNILVENGAYPSCCDQHGNTLLHKFVILIEKMESKFQYVGEVQWGNDWNALIEAGNSIIEKFGKAVFTYGVHVDVRNAKGKTASEALTNLLPDLFHPFEYETLKCLSARVLRSVNYPSNLIPHNLVHFVSLH